MEPLAPPGLPAGIRSRFVADVNGLTLHVLEAGFDTPDRPLLLLLHGFPELAYSWRHLMKPLAALGYHVVAPDQRGYGRTTGWRRDFDGAAQSYSLLNLVRDMLGLVAASCFIAGASDWGIYQAPGAFEHMQASACTRMLDCHLVEHAGHWVQQEQPAKVFDLLSAFLCKAG